MGYTNRFKKGDLQPFNCSMPSIRKKGPGQKHDFLWLSRYRPQHPKRCKVPSSLRSAGGWTGGISVPKIRKYQTKPNKLAAAPLANTWFWGKYIHDEPKRLVMPRSLCILEAIVRLPLLETLSVINLGLPGQPWPANLLSRCPRILRHMWLKPIMKRFPFLTRCVLHDVSY